MQSYWLMKSEPSCFSIDDLAAANNKTTSWDGVRNYQARNFMRDDMQIGDLVFFYHSNCNPPGIAGIAEIVRAAHPDYTAWEPSSAHPDPKSTQEKPRWFMVDIKFVNKFAELIPLERLKTYAALKNMVVLKNGNRLSITPVTSEEWSFILTIAEKKS